MVINSHGSPGVIHIGQGLSINDLHQFELLKKDMKTTLVEEIWIVACKVAGKDEGVSGGLSGDAFCKSLATTALSDVTAGTKNQYGSGPISIPRWVIDKWTGRIKHYFSNGVIFERGDFEFTPNTE